MFSDIYSLENVLMNNEFEQPSAPSFDIYKMVEAIRFLTQKVKDLEFQTLNQQTEQGYQQTDIFRLQDELMESKEIIRKIGKDYPELVLSYPQFFTKENNDNN